VRRGLRPFHFRELEQIVNSQTETDLRFSDSDCFGARAFDVPKAKNLLIVSFLIGPPLASSEEEEEKMESRVRLVPFCNEQSFNSESPSFSCIVLRRSAIPKKGP